MNENSYLNPADIKNQCDAAIGNLEKNSQATHLTEWNLNLFIGDSQLESEAFLALKQQMEDYKTVLQTIRTANQCDIEDFRTLKLAVGFQELQGSVILEQMNNAMMAKKSDEEKVEKYRKKANATNSVTLRINYTTKVAHYRTLAEIDQKLHDEWQKKEYMYDGIEMLTSGLFERGAAIRATIESALSSITGSFQNGVYVPDMNASWRSEVYAFYYNQVFNVSDNGEIKIDMEEVEKILSKDERDITDTEYEVLALAYLLADDEDLAVFIQCMMKDRKDYHFEIIEERDFSEWVVDHEKIEQLISRIEKTSLEELSLLQEIRASGDNMKALEYESQRDMLLQRLTLLNVINQFISFDGNYKADYPEFTITKNEKEDLVVAFLESKLPDEFGNFSRLAESTITVSNTINQTYIPNETMDYSKYLFVCKFGNSSVENYAINAARGKAIKNSIGCLAGSGKIGGIVLDVWMNEQKAKVNQQFIDTQFASLNAAKIYSEYDCRENIVEYNLGYDYEPMIFVYEGEETSSKIEHLNSANIGDEWIEGKSELEELLKKAFPPDGLTVDIVLTRPDEVYEFENSLPEELKNLYGCIVSGKIEEGGKEK